MHHCRSVRLTLSVQKVLHGNIEAAICVDGGISEDVLGLRRHELLAILLTKSSDMVPHAGSLELLVERDLLQLHVMDAGGGGAEQR